MMFLDYSPDDLDVEVSELLVATCEGADPLICPEVQQVLNLLREHMRMDVVFVSRIGDGRRTLEVVSAGEGAPMQPGDSDPVEETWCQHVVDGRLPPYLPDARAVGGRAPPVPFPVGTFISTPVRLSDGHVYGTLCSLSFQPVPSSTELDLKRLQYTAGLLVRRLETPGAPDAAETTLLR